MEIGRVVKNLTSRRCLREMRLGKVRAQGRGASALQSPGSMPETTAPGEDGCVRWGERTSEESGQRLLSTSLP